MVGQTTDSHLACRLACHDPSPWQNSHVTSCRSPRLKESPKVSGSNGVNWQRRSGFRFRVILGKFRHQNIMVNRFLEHHPHPTSIHAMLVGGPGPPLWKIWARQLGWLFPIYEKIKDVPNHPTSYWHMEPINMVVPLFIIHFRWGFSLT